MRRSNEVIGSDFKAGNTMFTLADHNMFTLTHRLAIDVLDVAKKMAVTYDKGIAGKIRKLASTLPLSVTELCETQEGEKRMEMLNSIRRNITHVKSFLLMAKKIDLIGEFNFDGLISGYQKLSILLSKFLSKGGQYSLF